MQTPNETPYHEHNHSVQNTKKSVYTYFYTLYMLSVQKCIIPIFMLLS